MTKQALGWAGLSVASFMIFAGIGIAHGSSAATQKQRHDYCVEILQPETCQILVEQKEYTDAYDCIHAMTVDGICDPPIKNTVGQMQNCVLELRNTNPGEPIPRSCLKLSKTP